jgi:hypothetical protein
MTLNKYYHKTYPECLLCKHNIPLIKPERRIQMCDESGKRLDKYLNISEELYNKIIKAVNDSKN